MEKPVDQKAMTEDEQNAAEKQWQIDVLGAISEANHSDMNHDISYLLKEPRRYKEHSLNFYQWSFSTNKDLGLYETPLQQAINKKCSKCIEKLLDAGAHVDYRDKDYELTRVMFAVHLGEPGEDMITHQLVQQLLEAGADVNLTALVNRRSGCYITALHIAAHSNYPRTTQLLLDYGAELPCTPFIAHTHNHRSMIEDSTWYTALESGRIGVLRVLLTHVKKFSLNIPLDSIFKVAYTCDCFDWANLRVLLSHGYIPDKNSTKAHRCLLRAVTTNSVESNKVAHMMLDQAPMMIHACRDLLIKRALRRASPSLKQAQEQLATPPALQQQCKATIISTIGHRYLEKVRQLGLPPSLVQFLASVEETE